MKKKAIIFDLDNTIYPVSSIGAELFASLFAVVEKDGHHEQEMKAIKADIMRRPFQYVANDYHFSDELTKKGMELLENFSYEGKMETFPDYHLTRSITLDKFLVTTGFLKLQQSKVRQLEIERDFKEIHIVDPRTSDRTKRDVFADIMQRYGYAVSDLLVVGDDLHSEIKAARELGIDVVLYDKLHMHEGVTDLARIEDFQQLAAFL